MKSDNYYLWPRVLLGLIVFFGFGVLCIKADANTVKSPGLLSAYATKVVGRSVTVHCQYMVTYQGYTIPTTETGGFLPDIYLPKGTCNNIVNLFNHKVYNYELQGNGFESIIHESYHLILDSTDEALVECTAMRNLWNYLKLLNLNYRQTKELYRWAWIDHNELDWSYTKTCNSYQPNWIYGIDPVGPTYKLGPIKWPKPVRKPDNGA